MERAPANASMCTTTGRLIETAAFSSSQARACGRLRSISIRTSVSSKTALSAMGSLLVLRAQFRGECNTVADVVAVAPQAQKRGAQKLASRYALAWSATRLRLYDNREISFANGHLRRKHDRHSSASWDRLRAGHRYHAPTPSNHTVKVPTMARLTIPKYTTRVRSRSGARRGLATNVSGAQRTRNSLNRM